MKASKFREVMDGGYTTVYKIQIHVGTVSRDTTSGQYDKDREKMDEKHQRVFDAINKLLKEMED